MSDKQYTRKFNTPGDYFILAGEHLTIAQYRANKRNPEGAQQAFEQAINIYTTGVERFPSSPKLYLDLGQALTLAKKFTGVNMMRAAEAAYDMGLQIEPKSAPLLRSKARLKMDGGFFEEAEELFFDAINADREQSNGELDVRLLESLADMYQKWNKPAFMAGCLFKAKKVEGGNMFLLKREYDLSDDERNAMKASNWENVNARILQRVHDKQEAAPENARE